jgi:hypothetical protein
MVHNGFADVEYCDEIFNQWNLKPIHGKFYLKLFFNSRIFQDIDIRHFSLFIESGNAWFNLSAYLACPFRQNRTDYTDIYLRFADENNGAIKNEIISLFSLFLFVLKRYFPHFRIEFRSNNFSISKFNWTYPVKYATT